MFVPYHLFFLPIILLYHQLFLLLFQLLFNLCILPIPMEHFSILGSTICSSQVHAATNPDENVAGSTMPYFFVYIGSIYKVQLGSG